MFQETGVSQALMSSFSIETTLKVKKKSLPQFSLFLALFRHKYFKKILFLMHRAFYVEDSHVYPNVTDRIIELRARSKYISHFVDEQQRPWEGDHKMRFAWKLSTCRQLSSRRHCSHSSHTTPPFLPPSLSSFFLVSLTSLQRSVSWVNSIIWALAAATPPSSQLWTFFYWVLSLAGLNGGEASRWKCFPLF